MATAKVIEIIAEGETIEKAINAGIREATHTLEHVKQFDIKHFQAIVESGKVVRYRVNGNLTFIVDQSVNDANK